MSSGKDNVADPLDEFLDRPSFHIVVPVENLIAAQRFYIDTLGCVLRSSKDDNFSFDFFGYSITAQRVIPQSYIKPTVLIRGSNVTLPYFGLVLGWDDWHRAVDHMTYIGVTLAIPPTVTNAGTGSLASFFLEDLSANFLEFKSFRANS